MAQTTQGQQTPAKAMGLLGAINPAWEEIDYNQLHVKVKIITSSFFFFAFVYLLCHVLSSLLKTYNGLRLKEKIFWNLAVVRATFGVFCTVVGIWALWWDQELKKDVVFATTPTSFFAICTTIGFFLFECSTLLVSDVIFRKMSILLNLHHWLSLVGYSLILWVGSTHYFATNGLILEMSTPFSALCWVLLKCGLADTTIWWLNQCVLVHSFHLRSVLEVFFWMETYRHWDHIWADMPTSMFVSFYTELTLVSLVMTPYWTYKKSAQLFNPIDWNFLDAEKTKTTNGAAKKEK
ncbi:protein CLN8-like isoform X1 [Branchiostoma lanceolatum]|uniref:protein CLN8-like isoform X1 n=1 Tax=Branchiostoma lanceolatum TaxID=7740 RepID=UPI0034567CDF